MNVPVLSETLMHVYPCPHSPVFTYNGNLTNMTIKIVKKDLFWDDYSISFYNDSFESSISVFNKIPMNSEFIH